MPQYTTGEMARLCEVSVRTVQYYDQKDLLHPSEVSEGGRRIYSEEDLKKFRLICVLKSFGLSLASIKGILASDSPNKVLLLFLEEQSKQLLEEVEEKQKKRKTIEAVRKSISHGEILSVNLIDGIESIMNGKKKIRKVHITLLVVGIILDLLQIATLFLWIFKGIWWPFVVMIPIVITSCSLSVRFYYRRVAYICPQCNSKFKPKIKEFFFAKHTSKTRNLVCTVCGHKGWSVETSADDVKE